MNHDPFRLGAAPAPLPVPGLPPPVALVEEDDDLLPCPARPRWVRVTAWALTLGLALGAALSAAAGRVPQLHLVGVPARAPGAP